MATLFNGVSCNGLSFFPFICFVLHWSARPKKEFLSWFSSLTLARFHFDSQTSHTFNIAIAHFPSLSVNKKYHIPKTKTILLLQSVFLVHRIDQVYTKQSKQKQIGKLYFFNSNYNNIEEDMYSRRTYGVVCWDLCACTLDLE